MPWFEVWGGPARDMKPGFRLVWVSFWDIVRVELRDVSMAISWLVGKKM